MIESSNNDEVAPSQRDPDLDSLPGQAVHNPVGPFDERDAPGREILLRPKSLKFVVPREPKNVKVVQRAAAGVFVAEDEGGADDLAPVDATGGSEGLNEARFAGPKRAAKSDDRAIRQYGSECSAEAVGIGEMIGDENE